MAAIRAPSAARVTSTTEALCSGDRLTQREFHRRYQAYPDDVKFELIGGVVHMASPASWSPHGVFDADVGTVLWLYALDTPGVETGVNVTTILGKWSEPQPDHALRIQSEFGGLTSVNAKGFLVGPPELVVEVSHTTAALDLHAKKGDYQRAGVIEYLVVWLEKRELHWFNLKTGRRLSSEKKGVYRSQIFPGLWIDAAALFARNPRRLVNTLKKGLANAEHAKFVRRLKSARRQ